MSREPMEKLIDSADRDFKQRRYEKALRTYEKILASRHPPETQIALISKYIICLSQTGRRSIIPQEIERFSSRFEPGSLYQAKLQTNHANFSVVQGDFDTAIEIGRPAFEILKPTGEMKTFAKIQLVLGTAYLSKGDLQESKRLLEGALYSYRRLSDQDGVLRSINRLAHLYLLSSNWDRSIDYWRQGLDMSQKAGVKKWVASFSLNLGMIYRKIGSWSLSHDCLETGISLSRKLKHPLGVIRGQLSLAALYRLERRWPDAQILLKKCRKSCMKERCRREFCLLLETLGDLAFDRGYYDEAGKQYGEAYRLAREIAPAGDLALELSRRLAELHTAMGSTENADQYTDTALSIAHALGDRFEEACVYRTLALSHSQAGRRTKALECFDKALKLFEELREKYERARTLVELGRVLRAEKKYDRGIRALNKAEELFASLPSWYWAGVSQFEIARVQHERESFDSSIASLNRALSSFQEAGETDSVADVIDLKEVVEEEMITLAIASTDDYVSSEENLDELVRDFARKIGAERAFLVVHGTDDFDVKGVYKMEEGRACEIFCSLNGSLTERPLLSTNLLLDRRFPHLQSDSLVSLLIIPFGPQSARGALYLDKMVPFTQRDLASSVRFGNFLALKMSESRQEELRQENVRLKNELHKKRYPDIVTCSKKMFEVFDVIDKAKDDPAPVLIEGETGTGKELVARAFHHKGRRRSKPFIPVDCGTLTKDLAGSELFGHKKGAFTDAKDDKVGLFEQANGGTLFLDEVTNLSEDVQAKLLRVLQEGRVRRIGEIRERKVNVRVIAASNKDLKREVAEGRFRKDLYYRLKGLTVHLAPLRHRREDIPLLVRYFADKFSREKKKEIVEISEGAMRVLLLYDWEGNVRELQNEVERAVVLMEEGRIEPELFSFTKRRGSHNKPQTYSLDDLVKALEANNWVKRKTARMLDIPESTLRKRLKTHGITVPPEVRMNRTHL